MNLSPSLVWARKHVVGALASTLIGGGLLGGLITTRMQLAGERDNNHIAAVQTLNFTRISAFQDSGADLDKKVAAFNDAAAEGRELAPYREAVRGALADHASKTEALATLFGPQATAAYMGDLKNLQGEVEATQDGTRAGRIISAMSRAIVARRQLAETALNQPSA